METFHKVFCFNRRNFLITLITLINEKLRSYKHINKKKKCGKNVESIIIIRIHKKFNGKVDCPYPVSSKQNKLRIIHCITSGEPDTGLDQGDIIQTPFFYFSLERSYFTET